MRRDIRIGETVLISAQTPKAMASAQVRWKSSALKYHREANQVAVMIHPPTINFSETISGFRLLLCPSESPVTGNEVWHGTAPL